MMFQAIYRYRERIVLLLGCLMLCGILSGCADGLGTADDLPGKDDLPPEEEVDFVLDSPFIFVITGSKDMPLFVGVVNRPAD